MKLCEFVKRRAEVNREYHDQKRATHAKYVADLADLERWRTRSLRNLAQQQRTIMNKALAIAERGELAE